MTVIHPSDDWTMTGKRRFFNVHLTLHGCYGRYMDVVLMLISKRRSFKIYLTLYVMDVRQRHSFNIHLTL